MSKRTVLAAALAWVTLVTAGFAFLGDRQTQGCPDLSAALDLALAVPSGDTRSLPDQFVGSEFETFIDKRVELYLARRERALDPASSDYSKELLPSRLDALTEGWEAMAAGAHRVMMRDSGCPIRPSS